MVTVNEIKNQTNNKHDFHTTKLQQSVSDKRDLVNNNKVFYFLLLSRFFSVLKVSTKFRQNDYIDKVLFYQKRTQMLKNVPVTLKGNSIVTASRST